MTKLSLHIRKLVCAALCLALALVLPLLTGQIPQVGRMLCPMHIPVFLCGYVCGWPWGLAVGFAAPLLRSAVFSVPGMPLGLAMAFELAVYGGMTGVLYRLLPKKASALYLSLIAAMAAGRVVWGAASYILAGLQGTEFTLSAFLVGAFAEAAPGIALQLLVVPLIVLALKKSALIPSR